MPAIILFDTKAEIPEHLQSEAREIEGGKYELNAAGVLKKNKELLGKNATLQTKIEETEAAKDAADAQAAEWKSKAKAPAGHKLVADDVAELGEAAKAASLTTAELPTLKTAKDDLQKQIDGFAAEKLIDEAAAAKNLNSRFKTAAQANGWKLEKVIEKVDNKDVEDFVFIGADNSKIKFEDFGTHNAFYKEFADTFKSDRKPPGNTNDPPPASAGQGSEEANKAAQTAMAQGIRSSF